MAQFILLDTETTGIEEKDRICQLAFLVLDKKKTEAFDSFCKPPVPISLKAMSIHHITNETIEHAPPYAECESAKKLEGYNTEENILVIQNAPFDLGMLQKEGFIWKGRLIDTLRCIKHLEPHHESHALQYLRYALGFYKEEEALAQELGITIKAHDALGDVVVLHQLMKYLVAKVDRDIARLVELTATPILYETITFGAKYKRGEDRYEDIIKKDRQYLEWALANLALDADVKYSIAHYLNPGVQ
jgi:DNA polymerase III epsilon subunit-like protein